MSKETSPAPKQVDFAEPISPFKRVDPISAKQLAVPVKKAEVKIEERKFDLNKPFKSKIDRRALLQARHSQ